MIKEQLKEPIALIWTLLSPSVMFYFILLSRNNETSSTTNYASYASYASYYYAYIAASVSFFGFAFYLIGRRESGFIRSFAYVPMAKAILLTGQLIAYSFISGLYCASLYLLTRPLFGAYDLIEFLNILARFYICFLMFCSVALALVRLPLTFQNANTSFSVLLFLMLATLIASRLTTYEIVRIANQFNPLTLASEIMQMERTPLIGAGSFAVILLYFMMWASARLMPVNPVWSRY